MNAVGASLSHLQLRMPNPCCHSITIQHVHTYLLFGIAFSICSPLCFLSLESFILHETTKTQNIYRNV